MREKYNTTTEATCFVIKHISKILVLDGKIGNSGIVQRLESWEFCLRL